MPPYSNTLMMSLSRSPSVSSFTIPSVFYLSSSYHSCVLVTLFTQVTTVTVWIVTPGSPSQRLQQVLCWLDPVVTSGTCLGGVRSRAVPWIAGGRIANTVLDLVTSSSNWLSGWYVNSDTSIGLVTMCMQCN